MESLQSFRFGINTPKVVFGPGAVEKLGDVLRDQGLAKPLFIVSPSNLAVCEAIKLALSRSGVADVQVLNTSTQRDANLISDRCLQPPARDVVVSLGGGTPVGLAKGAAIRRNIPHVCIPTTYSGSEMTPIVGELDEHRLKVARVDPKILPTMVLYDVNLTVGLPEHITFPSGMNAIAHAIEALYAEGRNPVTTSLALDSIRELSISLPALFRDPRSSTARSSALYGAFLAGMSIASTGIGLHHRLVHLITSKLSLPHAETHAVLLPHSLAHVASQGGLAARLPVKKLADALGENTRGDHSLAGVMTGLNVLVRRLGIARGLKELGMDEGQIDHVADVAWTLLRDLGDSQAATQEGLRKTIRLAWAGEDARLDS